MKDLADKLAEEVIHCSPPTIMYCISLLSLACSLVLGKPLCPVLFLFRSSQDKKKWDENCCPKDLQVGPGLAQHLSNEATKNIVQGQHSFKSLLVLSSGLHPLWTYF